MDFEEKSIGEVTYKVHKLPFGKWRQLGLKVGAIAGPALGKLVDATGAEDAESGNVGAVSEAAKLFFDNLSEAELDRISNTLAEVTVVDALGSAPAKLHTVMEVHFTKYRAHYVPWLAFALKTQLADFFGAGGFGEGLKALGSMKSQ